MYINSTKCYICHTMHSKGWFIYITESQILRSVCYKWEKLHMVHTRVGSAKCTTLLTNSTERWEGHISVEDHPVILLKIYVNILLLHIKRTDVHNLKRSITSKTAKFWDRSITRGHPELWNSLPNYATNSDSLGIFLRNLNKTHPFTIGFT